MEKLRLAQGHMLRLKSKLFQPQRLGFQLGRYGDPRVAHGGGGGVEWCGPLSARLLLATLCEITRPVALSPDTHHPV